ncbi:MAG: putative transcriptional regulator [Petroclostridium sp.]|jgi:putative transcriptional regulator|uniref:helix-turn-helix transcriptional regulator n=1 Tax=Petroclostridium xylanilyticum TaxID=1792311 RepID=UPI000B99B803|nr:helix-turn-helix transcriptional regulator [Petroclostridium xylanilyticum]MDK2811080.1 putative transcriptional regulator [Petroclostridium sp.]
MRKKLKEIRIKRNLTQKELAELAKIDRVTYTNIELGNKNPSLSVARKIKDALQYEGDDIFFENNSV